MQLGTDLLALAYLVSATLFILGLKGLTHPASARRGNYYAMAGMILAVAATLLNPAMKSYSFIVAGVLLGAVIGTVIALKIKMTAMPQLVALLHSFVGLTAVLVAVGTYYDRAVLGSPDPVLMTELFIGAFIGAITFTGSLVAFGKLQALLSSKPLVFRGQHQVNLVVSLVAVACGIEFVLHDNLLALFIMLALALLLGILLIVPIGGADMPVVVSMLNSYSGWAATATGFTLENNLLIITGALVGFSGAILSYIMSRAMNRSIFSIVFGGFGGGAGEETPVAVAPMRRLSTVLREDLGERDGLAVRHHLRRSRWFTPDGNRIRRFLRLESRRE